MARVFASWAPASRCTGSATPGCKALMAGVLEYEPRAKNLGIYNCRNVRGGSTTSLHGEGRAIDIGLPMEDGRPTEVGMTLMRELLDNADKLGIQALIYNRKIYSAKSPNGRDYNGVNPHYDHIHVELSWVAAQKLNLATVRAVLHGRSPGKPSVSKKPTAGKYGTEYKGKIGDRSVELWDRGEDVALLQRFLGLKDDGYFGKKTEDAVKTWQFSQDFQANGKVGKRGWARIQKAVKGI